VTVLKSMQSKEVDRWRTAVDIVRRLREAGIICELSDISRAYN